MESTNKGFLIVLLCIKCFLIRATVDEAKEERRDIYTSTLLIDKLFGFDETVGKTLKLLATRDEQVESYLLSYNWLVADLKSRRKDVPRSAVTGHTLHVYTLIKRMVIHYPGIRAIFNSILENDEGGCEDRVNVCSFWKLQSFCEKNYVFMANHCPKTCGLCKLLEGVRAVKKKEKKTQLPNTNDLKGILAGMGRLQMAYNTSIALMRTGVIHAFHTSVKLSAWDCLQIAYQLYEEGILTYTLLWFDEILNSFNDTETLTFVQNKRSVIANKHDKFWVEDAYHFPNLLSKDPHQNPVPSNFYQYCMKSREKRPVIAEEGLQCHLATKGNPFFLLHPLKQETLRTDPEMVVFHDVISDSEIETLKRLAKNALKRDIVDNNRRTEHIALQNVTHSVIDDIERRAEMFSGLLTHSKVRNPDDIDPEPLKAVMILKIPKVNTSELKKYVLITWTKLVRNYGACGDFGIHTDTFYIHKDEPSTNITDPKPERLATVLFYLNDVLEGGSTVFHECGVVVSPKKGSALLFYNMKKNGDFEKRSWHGSCPLTVGNKWVALKWFSDKYNFLTRQCSTNPLE